MVNYSEIIEKATAMGGLYDAALAIQESEGYLSDVAIAALSEAFDEPQAAIYDTLSFYSMIRFKPKGKVRIEICRGVPCHVAGSADVIAAIENYLGIKVGETTKDGQYTFEYTECIGQCQSSPSLVINDKLYTQMTADAVIDLLKKGGF